MEFLSAPATGAGICFANGEAISMPLDRA